MISVNYLVSVLTPVYNGEKFISRFIVKILEQTYNNVELVIINDGSIDKTEKIIFSYKKKILQRGYKLKYLKKKNGGVGSAINKGLKLMSGDFFTWCDADNFYDKNYIKENINIFNQSKKISIVRCDGYFVNENNLFKPYGKFSDNNKDKFKKKLFLNAILEINFHFGCAMIRTNSFDKINLMREIFESKQGQNWQLLLPMFYYYDSYYIDKALFYWVNRSNSITNLNTNNIKLEILQQNEHEKILTTVINSMRIRSKNYYLYIIKKKYIQRRIAIAYKYGDSNIQKRGQFELDRLNDYPVKIYMFILSKISKFNII